MNWFLRLDRRIIVGAMFGVPAIVSALVSVLPLAPPVKIAVLAVALALFSAVMLALSAYEASRRTPRRPRIALAWLALAAGFGCFAIQLWTMSQTWGLRWTQLPHALWLGCFSVGSLCLFAGVSIALRAGGRPSSPSTQSRPSCP
jgi:hypothetical protein